MIRRGCLLASVAALCLLSLSATLKRTAEPIFDDEGKDSVVSIKNVGLDPFALRNGVQSAIKTASRENLSLTYWDLLKSYNPAPRHDPTSYHGSAQHALSMEAVCSLSPGRGMEGDGGYKLLADKIRVEQPQHIATDPKSHRLPRIFCGVYTYSKMGDLARTMALSWGSQCDGFIAFTTEDIPGLGFHKLEHIGAEEYGNMWQKVRAIWKSVYENFHDSFDYFHLCGDDTYLIVNNLRAFLGALEPSDGPQVLGEHILMPGGQNIMVAGAPGYTINREALHSFYTGGLHQCDVGTVAAAEDRIISRCFHNLNATFGDTRDRMTAEQTYHDCPPNHLYTFRASNGKRASYHSKAAVHWESQAHPGQQQPVGSKHRLEAAAKHSIAFHDIYHPTFAARLHALIHSDVCPPDSVLGRALLKAGRYRHE